MNRFSQGGGQPPRLLQQVRLALELQHYSARTVTSYVSWVRKFITFHGKRHPLGLGAEEVRAFLSSLATERRVSASTQNQALAALLFLYEKVLHKPLDPVVCQN